MHQHLTDEELATLVDGGMDPSDRDACYRRLEACPQCYALFREVSLVVADARPRPRLKASHWIPLAVAAMFLVAWMGWRSLRRPDLTRIDAWRSRFAVNTDSDTDRAQAVFARLLDVTPEVGSLRLLVLDDLPGPWSMALDDGVVISSDAVRLCLKDSNGSAQLAAVLGHELEHVRRDERFHAYAAQRAVDDLSMANLSSNDTLRTAEVRADRWGLFRCALAGYSYDFSRANSLAFIQSWSSDPVRGASSPHLTAAQRVDALAATLDQVKHKLDLYELALKSDLLGHSDVAIQAWNELIAFLSSHELYTNRGLSNLRIAHSILAACDGHRAMRFWMPYQPDFNALLNRIRVRGEETPACPQQPEFIDAIDAALSDFQQALALNPRDSKARTWMLCARILADRPFSIPDDGSRDAAVNDIMVATISRYLYAINRKLDDETERAVTDLVQLQASHPTNLALRFNTGRILIEIGRDQRAASVWRELSEQRGPYGDLVRAWFGQPANSIDGDPDPSVTDNGERIAQLQTGAFWEHASGATRIVSFNGTPLWSSAPCGTEPGQAVIQGDWSQQHWRLLPSGDLVIDDGGESRLLRPIH